MYRVTGRHAHGTYCTFHGRLIADRFLESYAEQSSDVNATYRSSLNANLTNHPLSFATSFRVALHFYIRLFLHLHNLLCLNIDWVDLGVLALIPSHPPTLFPPTLKVWLRARTACLPCRAAFQQMRTLVFRMLMNESFRTRASSSEGTQHAFTTSLTNGNSASLPSNMDHVELTSMLSQHLSEHPQVKGIKVVRDSKGGACAFIQCQVCRSSYHSQPVVF